LHPMLGNRLGSGERTRLARLEQPAVDLLALAAFHRKGFAALLFDFRGHGESQAGLCAGGLTEDQDVVGAVNWVFERLADETPRVGVIGFGLGAAAALAAVGRFKGGTETMWLFSGDSEGGSDWTKVPPANIKRLAFLVAVDPVSQSAELRPWLRRIVGPLSGPLLALISRFCVWRGGFPLNPDALPRFAAGVNVRVLYVLSDACSEACRREVRALYEATPAQHRLCWSEAPPGPAQAGAVPISQLERLLDFAREAIAQA
jgi:pimeloyl-ACP methyl ester carboxylesterase